MSEEFDDVFGTENVDDQETESEEVETEQVEAESEDDTEQEQGEADDDLPKGYQTKEEWVAKGNNPDDWVSPEIYKERGHWIAELKKRDERHENQIKNLNTLHRGQLEMVKRDLLAKRDSAFEEGDKETFDKVEQQLADVNKQSQLIEGDKPQQPEQAQKPQVVLDWEAQNTWINDPNDPRTKPAQDIFVRTLSATNDPAKAVAAVNNYFAKPQAKTGRTESSTTRQAANQKKSLSMADLTADEKRMYEEFWDGDQKSFLKSVENARKGA